MKKYTFLLTCISLLILGSCNTNETEYETTSSPLLIKAVTEEKPELRSGVIEDEDYWLGEKLRWTAKDFIIVSHYKENSLLFDKYYQISTFNHNEAEFTSVFELQHDTYDILALSPFDWEENIFIMPAVQTQNGQLSEHLGRSMPMKAQAKSFEHNGVNKLNVDFKHLASVVRFGIWNNTGNNDLTVTSILLSTTSGENLFGTKGELANQDAEDITITEKSDQIILNVKNGAFIADSESRPVFNGYMGVLPTGTFQSSYKLKITVALSDNTNSYVYTKELSFNSVNEANFLFGGFKKGKSYYFRLKVNNEDLSQLSQTYVVGDYYPNPGNSANAIGVVYYLTPGSMGTEGRIISMDEGQNLAWGPNINEETNGVSGIKDFTNGKAATRNLISKYSSEAGFSTLYPVFNWIYQKNEEDVNGQWYLPSKDDFFEIENKLSTINDKLTTPIIKDVNYWLSLELDQINGIMFYISSQGYYGSNLNLKSNLNRARAISDF